MSGLRLGRASTSGAHCPILLVLAIAFSLLHFDPNISQATEVWIGTDSSGAGPVRRYDLSGSFISGFNNGFGVDAISLVGSEVWIGGDILRSSRHRHTRSLSGNPLVRLAGALGRLSAFRFFLGNDLFLKARKPA